MMIMEDKDLIAFIKEKSTWVRRETLLLHKRAPETRVASSLSDVEIFAVLYYGSILQYDPKNINLPARDRIIVSKGHGGISLYPILADCGFFDKQELHKVCQAGSFLGGIPDPIIPGFETVNGSLGHGLGVACGISLGLKHKKSDASVFVVVGDGELYEGSVWEAVMFAPHHKLDNLIAIVDRNKICMLDYCKEILDMNSLDDKFRAFNWQVESVDGHDVGALYCALKQLKAQKNNRPKVLIAETIKGKGVPMLEESSLCHILSVPGDEIDRLLNEDI